MNIEVKGGSSVELNDAVFGADFNENLVHQAVVAYLAGARQGTKAQKNRSAVSGGGRKPFRQKGTGRARAGTIRSPLWRSGGVTFAAQPRDFSQKLNRKMYRAALRSIVSELVRQERVIVVDSLEVAEPKTKLFVAKLAELGVSKGLVLVEEVTETLHLASRNIPNIDVIDVQGIDPVALVGADSLVVTAGALKQIEEALS